MIPSPDELTRVYRAESGRLIAVLVSQYRDLELAEDSLHDACLEASEQWVKKGLPRNPAAWLLAVARRRLIDRLRKSSRSDKTEIIEQIYQSLQISRCSKESDHAIPDERLKLIFTCCHPALSELARVALTLRTLCGLNTKEIARAYLISETTLQQRLTRAKRKIRDAGVAYKVPEADELAARLPSVLEVIYLIYNESYNAYQGQSLSRDDLAREAIRLARLLNELLPSPSVAGLLALMLIHHARNRARSSPTQGFIPLQYHDRSLWDQEMISEGRAILLAAMAQGQTDKYQIQAAISALHAQASSWIDTDWHQIRLLYDALYRIEPSAIVELNCAVAIANSGAYSEALKRLECLETTLSNYQPYHAALADIQVKSSLIEPAKKSYQRAIMLSKNHAERDFLIGQLDNVVKIQKGVK